ncbi:class I tRNA ligase family protein [Streptobacillus moniliformis]|uniref:class I tRNA ligase family protein n=1 Tax=Streptobacillus moniliformis TaxID=34105 RepID=UPI001E4F9CF7|nr:class I tRNA ligase family protein [Streptobacillus moniliformis]
MYGEVSKNTLKKLEEVKIVPEWGRNRIKTKIEKRKDKTKSRKKDWGVPIPMYL